MHAASAYFPDFVSRPSLLPLPSQSSEETVEPDQSEYYHGNISASEAEKRLKNAGGADGLFLLSAQSTTSNTYTLSLVYAGQVRHVKLSRTSKGDNFLVNDKPTGEPTLLGTIAYLSERQAGWEMVLTQGVKGIKVCSQRPTFVARMLSSFLAKVLS